MADDQDRTRQQPHLVSYIISPPVRQEMEQDREKRIDVIISLVEPREHPELGVGPAKTAVKEALARTPETRVRESDFYIFASLRAAEIERLSQMKEVYQIWKDDRCQSHLLSSTETVKAAASWRTFDAKGKGITWAVLDTGIRYDHPHFKTFDNIDRQLSKNLSSSPDEEDVNGHGTHVAGIIAGCAGRGDADSGLRVATYLEDEENPKIDALNGWPSGVAPLAKLVNVKVLDDDGTGSSSTAILGLEHIRKINQGSRQIRIDGANLSLGYPFDPKWYGCGHSPLCEEVRRAVNSGVSVVISCGNAGYGTTKLDSGQQVPIYLELSIADPANTEEAIAVGSAHKSAPHSYGISYFSSKGPTGDGRMKPDLVAPGEKVVSCSLHFDDPDAENQYHYEEKSGTSMAAPHVSGAIAGFLSVHREFRGNPSALKQILMKTATDLGRQRTFQGAGLVDMLRAIMSV